MPVLFSAHAEVFPYPITSSRGSFALLRARGGISTLTDEEIDTVLSSPRTRRYFLWASCVPFPVSLFSAHAEVFPA